MRPIRTLGVLGALALTLGACSSSAQLTDGTSTTTSAEPAATVTAGPAGAASEPSPAATPSPNPTATASPTPTPDLLVELAEELTRLGISDADATCIRERLAHLSADRDALEAAAPSAAALLDQVAQSCEVDLLDYLEPADE